MFLHLLDSLRALAGDSNADPKSWLNLYLSGILTRLNNLMIKLIDYKEKHGEDIWYQNMWALVNEKFDYFAKIWLQINNGVDWTRL